MPIKEVAPKIQQLMLLFLLVLGSFTLGLNVSLARSETTTTTKAFECSAAADEQNLPGSALLQWGYRNLVVATKTQEHSDEEDEPSISRPFPQQREFDDLVNSLTERAESGELWESNATSLFRYWQFNRSLESEAKQELDAGWVDRSLQFEEYLNTDRCRLLRGRYAMITPVLSAHTLNVLRNLTRTQQPHATLFAGCAKSCTALHFDSAKNYFLQLRGTKRFILFPPTALKNLRLSPSAHPLHRQSLIEPSDLSCVDWSKYSPISTLQQHVIVADLKPGDLLSIPEYWSHFVVSTSDDSLGLATRWPFDARLQHALYQLPLPFELAWTLEVKFAAIKNYLNLLLLDREQRSMFQDRWRFAFSNWKPSSSMLENFNLRSLQDDNNITALSKKFQLYADRVLATFRSHVAIEDIRNLLLLDYCDDVLITLLGPRNSIWFMLSHYE